MFRDRVDAGQKLAGRLEQYRDARDAVVLGVPRGGVVVAAEVARSLGLPLDIVVVRKIGAPGNPEYAIAAIDADGVVYGQPGRHASADYFMHERDAQIAEIGRREAEYRRGLPPLDVSGRTAIIIDDGIATGLTAIAAVEYARTHGATHVTLAAPVIARQTVHELTGRADEVVVIDVPPVFYAVGEFYRSFPQTADSEVVALLEASRAAG